MRAIVFTLVAGACYSPAPPRGAPCGENNACPTGQTCVAGFCGDTGTALDSDIVDVIPDVPLCQTWNARHFDACGLPGPSGDLDLPEALSDYTWNTDDDGALTGRMNTPITVITTVISQTDGPDILLASVDNFTLAAGAYIDVDGSRPLLIAVNGTATIAGTIDLRASFTTAGPGGFGGSTVVECPDPPTGDDGTTATPSSGGGGGAFQGAGGSGANAGGAGGVALPVPAVIRGGCAGGAGGASTTVVLGPRGAGGGAIQISARVAIEIVNGGSIGAGGGAGGYGRAAHGGGGGGGAGGYIGLDAPTIHVAGTLAANGGGGGGGASDVAQGSSGANGVTSDSAANGGAGAASSTVGTCIKGGNGSFGGTLDAEDASTSPCGGGGGGGGAGYILFWSAAPTVTGTVSPPALTGP